MNVWDYLNAGKEFHDAGYETDGCTFIGWLIHLIWGDKFDNACWSHDFARHDLIPVVDQSENDNLFKDALKELGAPRPLRFFMYFFTKTQGFFKDKFNMSLNAFLGFLFFIFIVFMIFYLDAKYNEAQSALNETHYITEKWKLPVEREDGTELLISEIAYHTFYEADCITKELTGRIINSEVQFNLTQLFWASPNTKECFLATTTDTDGRESVYSELFQAVEYNAPKTIECIPQ